VPDVPKLADGVRLSGDMEESAFVEPQWLAQRDGQFVQLTELLYRVSEQIDGQKNLEQIADGVGEAIDRDVTAANVRQLIGEKLIPLGLAPTADGSVARPPGAGQSPLQVNLKMAMVPPSVTQGLGKTLSPLYWPPVLVVVLAMAVLAQAWLYLVQGIGGSVYDVLYRPQLLLAVLGVIVVATGFHELGHAAALVYGGGRVRGMGAGIYLIYPAFYTDVTENYRLGRWGRVRTDLGGIYFNMIFAAGLIGVFMLTGWEFLLASVLLLNFQTIQQLLPFVRLDGYWVLADLTGIPDFFTHMGGFLRSVLPIKAWRGPKLPALKWWAKAVFAGYILIVVPLLAFLTFVALKGLPRFAATTWDSFQKQAGQFSGAFAGGDLLGAFGTLVEIVLLALPVLGLIYMLVSLGKGLFLKLWRWSEGDTSKRMVALVNTASAVVILAMLWLPQIPFAPPGTAGPLYAASGEWRPIAPDERLDFAYVAPAAAEQLSSIPPVAYTGPTARPTVEPTPSVQPTPDAERTPTASTPVPADQAASEGEAHPEGTRVATPLPDAAAPTAVIEPSATPATELPIAEPGVAPTEIPTATPAPSGSTGPAPSQPAPGPGTSPPAAATSTPAGSGAPPPSPDGATDPGATAAPATPTPATSTPAAGTATGTGTTSGQQTPTG
jgi:putative peptide zinc metalloprotease protein